MLLYDGFGRGSTMTIENNMGTDKISRLLLKTGIPLMLSLLINSL